MPIFVAGFFVLRLPIGVAGQFSLVVLISFAVTFLICEIVKRIPVLRFFWNRKAEIIKSFQNMNFLHLRTERFMTTAFKKGLAPSLYGTTIRSYIENEGGVAY